MKHNNKKILASLLAATIVVSSLAVPAGAAGGNHSVRANYNGERAYLEDYPEDYNLQSVPLFDIGVGVDAAVTVSSGSYSVTSSTRPISMTGTLPNGTVYRLSEGSNRVVSLTTTSQIKDDIEVSVTTTPHSYMIHANSGPKDFKSNLGSTSNPTCSVTDAEQAVEGNTGWSVTFTPNSGGLVINQLNIRSSAGGQNIVAANAGAITVSDTQMKIAKNGDGSVTVTADHAAGDMYVTALTESKPAQYTLKVSTDGSIEPDVKSTTLDAGATQQVTLAANSGYLVDTITITDGGKTGMLSASADSVSVNGHTYSITRGLDGKVVLSVPGVSADVSIHATASSDKVYLQVETDSGISCSYKGVSYLNRGGDYTVRLVPDDDSEITSIRIESTTDSVTLSSGDYRFMLDGVYYYVDTNRVNYDYGYDVNLHFPSLPGNLRITASSKETYHTITLKADSGADYEGRDSKIRVEDGDSQTVSFLANSNQEIEQLAFTYKGNTYKVDKDDSYIRINGARCPINWNDNGRVTVTLYDIEFDIAIKAITDARYSDRDYTIYVETDRGATYSGSSKVYVDDGDNKTITFTPVGNYSIERLVITRKGSTYRVDRDDSYVTINGTRNTVNWYSNGKVSIALKDISADMTVAAETTCDGSYRYGTYRITKNEDTHSTITVIPNSSSVNSNQSVEVTVTPDRNYYLQRVTVKLGNTSKTLYTTTNSFSYNGTTYQVTHYSDGSMGIYFYQLPNDLTITSKATRGTDPDIGRVDITDQPTFNNNYHIAYIAGIGNGKFAPYQTTTRAEAVVMLVRAFYGATGGTVQDFSTPPFTDVSPNAWYASFLTYAYNQGMLKGLHDVGTRFRPQEPITRAEYTELACRFAGVTASGNYGKTFKDVPASHWANATVGYAASRGWVEGYGNNEFDPDSTIKRAELVAITNRVLNRTPDRTYINNNLRFLNVFNDVDPSYWAYYEIIEAANNHYGNNRSSDSESWGI